MTSFCNQIIAACFIEDISKASVLSGNGNLILLRQFVCQACHGMNLYTGCHGIHRFCGSNVHKCTAQYQSIALACHNINRFRRTAVRQYKVRESGVRIGVESAVAVHGNLN